MSKTTIKDLETRVKKAEKIGTCKVNISHDGENEGIWACFVSEHDKEVYDKNTSGDKIDVYLMNHALIGGPTWGAKLTVTTQGAARPSIKVEDVRQQMQEAVANGDYPPKKDFDNLKAEAK
jgi:hypothetical protein